MNNNNPNPLTLRDIFEFYFRHQWKILYILFLSVGIVTVLVYYFPEQYEVKAKLMVKVGRETMPATAMANKDPMLQPITKLEESINSEVDLLTSGSLLNQLVADLGPDFFKRPRVAPVTLLQSLKAFAADCARSAKDAVLSVAYALDIIRKLSDSQQTVLGIRKNLGAFKEKDSNIITLVYKTADPEKGCIVLNRLIRLYLEDRISIYKTRGVYAFYEDQVKNYEAQLKKTEDSIDKFKAQRDITALDTQKDILLRRVLDERRNVDNIRSDINEASTLIDRLSDRLAKLDPSEETMRQVNKNTHFAEEQRQVNAISTTTGVNPTYKTVEGALIMKRAELAAKKTQLAEQQRILQQVERELERVNASDTALKRLTRDLGVIESNYLMYKAKMEEGRVQDALDRSRIVNVTVAAPASSSIAPLMKMKIIPRKIYFIMLAVVISLTVAIIYCLLLDYLDRRVVSERDVREVLGLEVLGTFHLGKALSKSEKR